MDTVCCNIGYFFALHGFCDQQATGINNTNVLERTRFCITKLVQLNLALFGLPGFTESKVRSKGKSQVLSQYNIVLIVLNTISYYKVCHDIRGL